MNDFSVATIAATSTPPSIPITPSVPMSGLDWTTIIVAIVTGVTTGLLAPMVAPYMTWYFKRKERQEERYREIIKEFRAILDDEMNFAKPSSLFNHHYFSHIENSVTPKTKQNLQEMKSHFETYGPIPDEVIEIYFRQILTKLERKWGLIGK